MNKPPLGIDWDGTCVEHVWPDEGQWLPDAVEALHVLNRHFQLYIFSCRVAPYNMGEWDTPRDPEITAHEIAYIRRMLDEAELGDVEIWTKPFKLPAVAYIDDRAIPFGGNWGEALVRLGAFFDA